MTDQKKLVVIHASATGAPDKMLEALVPKIDYICVKVGNGLTGLGYDVGILDLTGVNHLSRKVKDWIEYDFMTRAMDPHAKVATIGVEDDD